MLLEVPKEPIRQMADESLRHRDLANREEAADRKPATIVPAEAEEEPVGTAPAQAGHKAVTADLRDRAERDDWVLALLFRERSPEGKLVLDLRWRPRVRSVLLLDLFHRVVRGDVTTPVEEPSLEFHDAVTHNRETFRGDGAVGPVIATGSDHLFERLTVIDRETEDVGRDNLSVRNPAGLFTVEALELPEYLLAVLASKQFVEGASRSLDFREREHSEHAF